MSGGVVSTGGTTQRPFGLRFCNPAGFRNLMPIGRRGDEMIRQLAEVRLAAVILLNQTAEILVDGSCDHRLQGAARAQVRNAPRDVLFNEPQAGPRDRSASGWSISLEIYSKSTFCLKTRTHRATLVSHDLALDIIANVSRAIKQFDCDRISIWATQRWNEASEQIELMYGYRSKVLQAASAQEKSDGCCRTRSDILWRTT